MRFTKMQALGNDFIFIGSPAREITPDASGIAGMCDRHYGIGADCLISVCPSRTADYRIRIFNANGSEAEICGNALICSAHYVRTSGFSSKTGFYVETQAGVRNVAVGESGITAEIGTPQLLQSGVIELCGRQHGFAYLSLGNPHCVVFSDVTAEGDISACGTEAEHHPLFENGANVEFAFVSGRNEIVMRPWERGIGETLSCATGSCACAAAAQAAGLCGRAVSVYQRGGILLVETDGKGCMSVSGKCETVYTGEIA